MNCTPIGTNAATAANKNSKMAVPANAAGNCAATPVPDANAPVSLFWEIADIMHSFGDIDRPHPESVKLVEHILQQQLRGIFHEATKVAMRRIHKPYPSQEDFELLMINHPKKIARMRKHLDDLKTLRKFLSLCSGAPNNDIRQTSVQQDNGEQLAAAMPEMDDDVRTRRLFRADRVSQIVSGQQYLQFIEARKTSFYSRNGEKMKHKFESFLNLPTDPKLPTATMNILAYFAHETIAVIVDYAILTRLNSSNRITEQGSIDASPTTMTGCPEVTEGRGMEAKQAISVQEIREAFRRFQQMTGKKMGFYRNSCGADFRTSYLAL